MFSPPRFPTTIILIVAILAMTTRVNGVALGDGNIRRGGHGSDEMIVEDGNNNKNKIVRPEQQLLKFEGQRQRRRRLRKISKISEGDAELACADVNSEYYDLCVSDVMAANDKRMAKLYWEGGEEDAHEIAMQHIQLVE